MSDVRFRHATRYGAKLFGYLLGVVVVAGGALGLGAVLAGPELEPLLGSGAVRRGRLAGGVALGLLGVVILGIGLTSVAYKLVADAVAAGQGASAVAPASVGAPTAAEHQADTVDSATDESAQSSEQGEPATDPAQADSPSEDDDGERFPPGWSSQKDAADQVGNDRPSDAAPDPEPPRADRPEPSAAEIAFGPDGDPEEATDETSGADPGDATEATPTDVSEADPVDVSETTSDAAVEPAGRNAPSDPLGDRSEDD